MSRMRIGIVGCGKISDIYLSNLTTTFSSCVEVVSISDVNVARAKYQAEKYGVNYSVSYDALLSHPDIDTVLNLTTPKSHYDISVKAIDAGKSVYTEKPLSASFEEGRKLVNLAIERNLPILGAPDTFLGAGFQTCRKLIDEGAIGRPLSANAFMICHGWETDHENPDFYYLKGGGPMFDMGPYYLTALIFLLGSANSVAAMASTGIKEREVMIGARRGEKLIIEVPTHITGTIMFDSGAIATVITTFDGWDTGLPNIQIVGSEGTLICPDPNTFGGPVTLRKADSEILVDVPLENGYTSNVRGIGIAEAATAIKNGYTPMVDAQLGLHVLEIMEAFHNSAENECFVDLETSCVAPYLIGSEFLS